MARASLRRGLLGLVGLVALLFTAVGAAPVGAANPYTAVGCPSGNDTCFRAKTGFPVTQAYGFQSFGYSPYTFGTNNGFGFNGFNGGRFYYQDNRFCGNGQLFTQNGQYFCASTGQQVFGGQPFGNGFNTGFGYGYGYNTGFTYGFR